MEEKNNHQNQTEAAGKEVVSKIKIRATPARLWKVLTEPEYTKQYMFGCITISDWKPGSDLLWEGEYEGNRMVFVKGKILSIWPEEALVYTVIDPNASYPDIPENHLRVTYMLEALDDSTELTVIQDGFEDAADGEKRYQDTYNNGEGWMPILEMIKKIAETAE